MLISQFFLNNTSFHINTDTVVYANSCWIVTYSSGRIIRGIVQYLIFSRQRVQCSWSEVSFTRELPVVGACCQETANQMK